MTLGLAGVSAPVAAQRPRADTIERTATTPLRPGLGRLVYDGVTIGSLDGSPDYTFVHVAGIQVSKSGSIYVLDASLFGGGTPLLREFNSSGTFVRRIGRLGDGPGEFRRPDAIALTLDGRLLLLDPLGRRVNVYSQAGQPIGTWRAEYRILRNSNALAVSPAGLPSINVELVKHVPPPPQPHETSHAIVRLRANGSVLDTLMPPEVADLLPTKVTKSEGRTFFSALPPYLPTGLWAWSPLGYFVTARTDQYAINILEPGKAVLRVTRAVNAVPVSDAERADQKRFTQQQLDAWPGKQTGTLPDVPRVKPFFRSIRFDADGRLLVRVSTPSERYRSDQTTRSDQAVPEVGWRSPTHFDVFQSNGIYVGRFAVPDGVDLRFMRGDQVWAVERDEMDVEYIKRYRIVW